AADIGAGAATEMDARLARVARRLDFGDLAREDLAALRVLVPQIDVDVGGLDRPGTDQHAFEKAIGIGLEIMAILEGAGLALVGIDRHEARPRLVAHKAPFAPGREARAAEPAQPRIIERLDDVVDRAAAGEAFLEELEAALGAIFVEADAVGNMRVRVAR